MKFLFFGDIIGKTGRRAIAFVLPSLKKKHKIDLVIANAENIAHGIGVTVKTLGSLIESGVDFFTSGNNVFRKPNEVDELFRTFAGKIIRPMNFEGEYAGSGYESIEVKGKQVYIANFIGQVFMENQFSGLISSPFKALDDFLQSRKESDIIIVDFHSEATSEKRGFGFYADGRVSAVLGTHTHVQTADAQILPHGTAYISDTGMVGAANTVLGVSRDRALELFLGKKSKIENMVESNEVEVGYVVVEIDEQTGKAKSIKSFYDKTKISQSGESLTRRSA